MSENTIDYPEFNKVVLQAIQDKGTTKTAVAKKIGIGFQTMQKFCNNNEPISFDSAISFAKELGISLDSVFGLDYGIKEHSDRKGFEEFFSMLKELRIKAGVSIESLSKSIGISPKSLSKYEKSIQMPHIDKVVSLCKFFKVSLDSFFNLGEKREDSNPSMPEEYKKFQMEMKTRRESLGLTFEKVSELVGVPVNRISDIEDCKVRFKPEDIKLCAVYNMSEATFIYLVSKYNFTNRFEVA